MNDSEPLAHSAKKDRGILAQTYAEHIAGVKSRAVSNFVAISNYFNEEPRLLIEVVQSAAVLHDLGKLDNANQEALQKGDKRHLPVNHVDAGTALLCQQGNKESALMVYGHHIGLCSIPQESAKGTKLFFRDEKICGHTNEHLAEYIKAHRRWYGAIESPASISKTAWSALTRRLMFSCLIDADYGDSAGETIQDRTAPRWEERLKRLDAYVASLAKDDADSARTSQRQKVYRACKHADVEPSIYACDSPVGTGKTTAVMAHLLRAAQKKDLRHIFVVLPYTNIIKQSVEVYRKALVLPGENPEVVVAEHHHQADFSDEDTRRYAALWTAPIIVTTAVQFFETLGANHPGKLRKLHELPGSAVFLDEAHATIPSYLWPQAWEWMRELRQKWKCHFVLASGSLPKFWENEKIANTREEVAFLLPNNTRNSLHDTETQRINYKQSKIELSKDQVIEFVCSKPGPHLVILNTVQSAAVLAWEIKKKGKQVIHLSTALTPNDRDKIVEAVKKKLADRAEADWTLVATSCVEAGMDFSFATAFRESCCATSLIQVGGRVNRHGERACAEVWDFKIADPLMKRNLQFETSINVLKKLFESQSYERNNATEIVTEAMRLELMSDFGDFASRAEKIKNAEKTCDFPVVADQDRVIDANTRMVVISKEIADEIEHYKKVNPIDLIRNSTQIGYFKIASSQFKAFCLPIKGHEEIYRWTGEYDSNFLGYMSAIVPLLEIDTDNFAIA